jgi:uncharacterized protein (DUF2062 family)
MTTRTTPILLSTSPSPTYISLFPIISTVFISIFICIFISVPLTVAVAVAVTVLLTPLTLCIIQHSLTTRTRITSRAIRRQPLQKTRLAEHALTLWMCGDLNDLVGAIATLAAE